VYDALKRQHQCGTV
jgi:threonyl-tRNA synthetase